MSLSSPACIEAIFIAPLAGAPMVRVQAAQAQAGVGLAGDRYALGTGYYSAHDPCEVTAIGGEALERIAAERGIRVRNGEHRRNIVTRGVALRELDGRRLRIGGVVLEYARPRPPCNYVERITEPGMTRALGADAGIAMRVVTSGLLREGDTIEIVPIAGERAAS